MNHSDSPASDKFLAFPKVAELGTQRLAHFSPTVEKRLGLATSGSPTWQKPPGF